MIIIIIGLIVLLVIGVVVVSGIQQHKAKLEQDKRAQTAKFRAIIDESQELINNLVNMPSSPALVSILHLRSLNAAKSILQLTPASNPTKQKIKELQSALEASKKVIENQTNEDAFTLPENEKELVSILQTIKKLRMMLKSEQAKGTLDAQTFSTQDLRLDALQLKIGVESIMSRGKKAYSKDMLGSARQYFEKAMSTLKGYPHQSEYTKNKRVEIEDMLEEITTALQATNASDAAKKAKDEENDLDMLFQPKKKW